MQPRLRFSPPPAARHTEVEYDACVIGSGASGAVVANALVTAGRSVLMLERGPFMPPDAHEERDGMVAADAAYVPSAGGPRLKGRPWTTCNVGGGTVFYGGVTLRPRHVDFRAAAHFPESDLPIDWPFGYEALAPHFELIERLQGVSGDVLDDPLHPGGHPAGLLPPLPRTAQGEHLFRAAAGLGLHPFQTPLSILSRPHSGRAACAHLTPCDEFRCPGGAKGDAYTVFLRPVEAREELTLFAGLAAVRLVRDAEERVGSVEAVSTSTGESYRFRAKSFFVAANAIQSAALLLRSGDRWEPAGIGNRHDLVGRGLCMKASRYSRATIPELESGRDYRGPFSTFMVMDHYLDASCPSGMGGLLYENHMESMEGAGTVLIEALMADLPRRRNRVALARDTDDLGLPRILIDYETAPIDRARLDWLTDRGADLLRAAGARAVGLIESDYEWGSCHLHGTCRAGDDPRTSVVAPDGRVHGVENVYVVDGGFMPFPTGVNPTLTIQANAHRIVSAHLEAGAAALTC